MLCVISGTQECWRHGGGFGDQLSAAGECFPSAESRVELHRHLRRDAANLPQHIVISTHRHSRFYKVQVFWLRCPFSFKRPTLMLTGVLCQVMMDFLKEWETKLQMKITCSQVRRCYKLIVY